MDNIIFCSRQPQDNLLIMKRKNVVKKTASICKKWAEAVAANALAATVAAGIT